VRAQEELFIRYGDSDNPAWTSPAAFLPSFPRRREPRATIRASPCAERGETPLTKHLEIGAPLDPRFRGEDGIFVQRGACRSFPFLSFPRRREPRATIRASPCAERGETPLTKHLEIGAPLDPRFRGEDGIFVQRGACRSPHGRVPPPFHRHSRAGGNPAPDSLGFGYTRSALPRGKDQTPTKMKRPCIIQPQSSRPFPEFRLEYCQNSLCWRSLGHISSSSRIHPSVPA
jgi:hypothetical protein